MALQFTTPVGRFVQGDAFEPQTKDQQGNLRVVKTGPNAGQPSPQWFVAVAFLKTDPAWLALKGQIYAEAVAAWPSLFPHGYRPDLPNGGCVLPTFATKVIDGDGFDTMGKPNTAKEGFAGHDVVRFSSGFAPKCYPVGRYTPADMITDPKLLRRGYYVRVLGSAVSNENPQRPGLYMNLGLIECAGYGPEIVSGPDAATAFAAPAALPAGASAIPIATGPLPGGVASPPGAPPAPPMPPGAPVAPSPPPYGGYMGPAGGAPPVAPPAPAPPPAPTPTAPSPSNVHPAGTYDGHRKAGWTEDQLRNAGMIDAGPLAPAAPAAPPPAPPAPARVMLPAAAGATYEALIAAGWTDATLVQHGMMVA